MDAVVCEEADNSGRAVVLDGRVVVEVDHVVVNGRGLDAKGGQGLLKVTVLAFVQGLQCACQSQEMDLKKTFFTLDLNR